MRETLREHCERLGLQRILEEWDRERNLPMTPETVSYGSKKKMWWRCKQGHVWDASITSRSGGKVGCPVCSGHRILLGYNDLWTKRPEIAAEWDTEKNGSLTPNMVGMGSYQYVWWKCPQGHSYRARVCMRTRKKGSGCPYCSRKVLIPGVNDPTVLYPKIAGQWDKEKNLPQKLETLTSTSVYRGWWRCEKGHSYKARVIDRIYNKQGCPFCAGKKAYPGYNDLATHRPDLAKEWYMELNAPLTPEMVTLGSGKRVWWRCQFGHVWKAAIFNRVGRANRTGTGCPICVQNMWKQKWQKQ